MNKTTTRNELFFELGKYLLDLSKLTFGGVILAGLLKIADKGFMAYSTLFMVGFISAGLLSVGGFVFLKIGHK